MNLDDDSNNKMQIWCHPMNQADNTTCPSESLISFALIQVSQPELCSVNLDLGVVSSLGHNLSSSTCLLLENNCLVGS